MQIVRQLVNRTANVAGEYLYLQIKTYDNFVFLTKLRHKAFYFWKVLSSPLNRPFWIFLQAVASTRPILMFAKQPWTTCLCHKVISLNSKQPVIENTMQFWVLELFCSASPSLSLCKRTSFNCTIRHQRALIKGAGKLQIKKKKQPLDELIVQISEK